MIEPTSIPTEKGASRMDNEMQVPEFQVSLGQPPEAVEVGLKRGPGRPPLPADERLRRRAEQKERYAVRNEARRRALTRLRRRYVEDFEEFFAEEMQRLVSR